MIKLPKSWSDITYKQFVNLNDIDKDENIFLQYINMLSILTNTNPTDKIWDELGIEDLKDLIKQINFINHLPDLKLMTEIDNFILINNEKLTLGEYIDLDYYFSENYLLNLPKIAGIYYRQFKHDQFHNIIVEHYDSIDINERALDFSDLPIVQLLPLINYFNDYKQMIFKNLSHLFIQLVDEADLDEQDLTDIETQKEIAKEKSKSEWNWILILHNLSNGDITKYNAILNLPLIFVLNNLSFKKTFNLD